MEVRETSSRGATGLAERPAREMHHKERSVKEEGAQPIGVLATEETARPTAEDGHLSEEGSPAAEMALGRRNRELGRKGEEAAARFLYARGYEILERNWTCFAGEADIIARDGDILVFVEVKTRRNREKGFPSERVDARKRDKYERIALAYVADCPYVDIAVRFDVVSIVVVGANKAMIRHDIDAFSAS